MLSSRVPLNLLCVSTFGILVYSSLYCTTVSVFSIQELKKCALQDTDKRYTSGMQLMSKSISYSRTFFPFMCVQCKLHVQEHLKAKRGWKKRRRRQS